MKYIFLFITGVLMATMSSQAQNDTMFVMQSGNVIGFYKVSEIDSIVFYKPLTTVTDIDGNIYNTLTIGNQVWMKENLKTTRFNDGEDIPLVTGNSSWVNSVSSAYCWYNNDINTYSNPYGALYNFYAVTTGKLCPTGWHVPTEIEWIALENYLIDNGFNYDGSTVANMIALSMSTGDWSISGTPGSPGSPLYPEIRNKSGFSAHPAGFRYEGDGTFYNINAATYWWTSNGDELTKGRVYYLYIHNNYTSRSSELNQRGLSVRCMKD